jgi:hypothetical protein
MQRWQVTIPGDAATSRVTMAAVALSFVPWMLFFGAMGAALFSPSFQSVSHALFLCGSVHLNEKFVKPRVVQPRPSTSLLKTSGMPSTHTLLAYGSAAVLTRYALFAALIPMVPLYLLPAVWAAYLPVAWARVHVGDHTVPQVVIGAAIGLVLAQLHGAVEATVLALFGMSL